MNKKVVMLSGIILSLAIVIALLGLVPVVQAGNVFGGHLNFSLNVSGNGTGKMTYGLCISNFAKQQNNCLKTANEGLRNCMKAAINSTSVNTQNATLRRINQQIFRNESLNCRNVFKNQSDICKNNFNLLSKGCGIYNCEPKNHVFINSTCVNKCVLDNSCGRRH